MSMTLTLAFYKNRYYISMVAKFSFRNTWEIQGAEIIIFEIQLSLYVLQNYEKCVIPNYKTNFSPFRHDYAYFWFDGARNIRK